MAKAIQSVKKLLAKMAEDYDLFISTPGLYGESASLWANKSQPYNDGRSTRIKVYITAAKKAVRDGKVVKVERKYKFTQADIYTLPKEKIDGNN